ncbi:UPF0524 protein C3orf70 homolog [Ochotona curzoniae]|uniref:UPF0524 protein C3orf70 homolog n=1 Tax=Ochotona curzoniae TaxID=130825 RepID=UPI001B351FEA|nr:UPF0524 protein C3orf70 homolog [Ochotona curzoniae]
MSAAAPAPERGWKSEKVDEAQALARSCAARRPDFQPCDGLSICATHSHGKCFKLHWCCHLGWCHYQPLVSCRLYNRPVQSLPHMLTIFSKAFMKIWKQHHRWACIMPSSITTNGHQGGGRRGVISVPLVIRSSSSATVCFLC